MSKIMPGGQTKAHVFCGISLDGYIARADGDLDFLDPFGDDEALDVYNEFVAGIDVFVFGRGTFEKVLQFEAWPFKKPVFVLSRSMKQLPSGFEGRATILSEEPAAVISALTANGFKAAYIDGGKIVQSFLRAGLVETITLSRAPVLVGSGIPLFGELDADVVLEHVRTHVCTNGMVKSCYKIMGASEPGRQAAAESERSTQTI